MNWDDLREGDVLIDNANVFLVVKRGPNTPSGLEVDLIDLENWTLRLWFCRDKLLDDMAVLRGGQTLKKGR